MNVVKMNYINKRRNVFFSKNAYKSVDISVRDLLEVLVVDSS